MYYDMYARERSRPDTGIIFFYGAPGWDALPAAEVTPGGPCSQSTTSCVYLRSVEYYSRLL